MNFEIIWKNLCIYEKSNKSHLQFGIEKKKKESVIKEISEKGPKIPEKVWLFVSFSIEIFQI